MKSAMPRGTRRLGLVFSVIAGTFLLPASPARALTPESPEVEAAGGRACAFLAKNDDPRPGARALVGLVFLKAKQPDHPRVQQGLKAIANALQFQLNTLEVYSVRLMLTFLTELPNGQQAQHANTINTLIAQLKAMQKPHGGWGYPHLDTGDTSMTQNAVLGLWAADAAGYDTPLDCWEQVANWALRTQAPDGGFGYQANDPGSFTPIEQKDERESLCAAGSGILYMCADYFGLLADQLEEEPDDAVLKKVKKPDVGRKGKETNQVDREMLWERIGKANQHMDAVYNVHPQIHPYYYLYALERYQTLKDYSEGILDQEVAWYDECAKALFSRQQEDGSWKTWHLDVGDVCDTCFATLFLLRSMRQTIEKRLGGGVLEGGRLDELERRDKAARGIRHRSLDEILRLLDELEKGNWVDLNDLQLAGDDDEFDKFRDRLRELLADAQSPETKRVVLRKLAELHNLDDVPLLIEALRDADPAVYCAANDALRFLSRKFSAPGLSDEDDAATRKAVIAYWEKWHQSLHPGSE